MAKLNINLDSLKAKKEWVRHKVKDGTNTFRFLPPFGEGHNGFPYRKWFVTWGLIDPTSGNKRPFASSKTYEGSCPIFEYCDLLKKKLETLEADMIKAGNAAEDIAEYLKPLQAVLSNLNPKSGFVYNAVDKSGVIGVLEVRASAHKAIKELMLEYVNDYNQDPTSLNSEEDDSGVWFNIMRTGKGFGTEYSVKKAQNKTRTPGGTITFADDRSPLPESVVLDFEKQAYDLNTVYQKKTYQELKDILVANITLLAKEMPELAIEGFVSEEEPVELPAAKPAPVAAPKAAPKVTLNLSQDDDEEETEEYVAPAIKTAPIAKPLVKPATTNVKPALTAKKATNSDEIMALAASVFDDL